jgi:uncharacterized protein
VARTSVPLTDRAMIADPTTFNPADPLDAAAVRVLGSLVEKAFTTPDSYPLSLNSLTAACNQTSNREPVMDLDEGAVTQALGELMRRSLAREVYRSDSRVKRYRHLLEDTLRLHDPEKAVLCVLLLRGPQTVGEIKARTGRMVEFIDLSHVEITLQALMTLPTPLVIQLPRQPGRKELRYTHALSGEPQQPAPVTAGEAHDTPSRGDRLDALEQEVASLRSELGELRAELEAFRREFQ